MRVNSEPIAKLIQESLAQIGITLAINKVPGSNWRSEMAKKSMPMMVNFFSGWLDYPEYFFSGAIPAKRDLQHAELRQQRHGRVHRRRRAAAAVHDKDKYATDVEGSFQWPIAKCRACRCSSHT